MTLKKLNPGHLLELSGVYWQACVLHVAVKLDLFTKIGNKNLTDNSIAIKLKVNKRAVVMLLNALCAMKLLTKKDKIYKNTLISKSFLNKDSKKYIGHIIMHQHYMMNSWVHLDRALKTGKPIKDAAKRRGKLELESFLMGMFNIAMNLAPQLVKKINISKRKNLLDLGGGPGTYAIHFCLNNPQLKATVCDLEATKPFAKNTIKEFGLNSRIDFKTVDFLCDDIPGKYDVAWLSHILHQEGSKVAQRIIRKAVSALNPGGMIIIHDFILNNTMDGPLFPAIFSLNMLLATKNGKSYSEKEIKNMLTVSGVKKIKRIRFNSPNDSGIILGIKE